MQENKKQDIKPGIKTTEAWVTAIVSLFVLFSEQIGIAIDPHAKAGLVTFVAGLYVFGRSWVKQARERN